MLDILTRRRILWRDGGRCVYCGNAATEVDHIHPRVHYGSHQDHNLAAACSHCNALASGRLFRDFAHKHQWLNWARRNGNCYASKSSRDHRSDCRHVCRSHDRFVRRTCYPQY